MTDTTEIIKENTDSLEITSTSKGDMGFKIKVYGDSKTKDGVKDLERRVDALKDVASRMTTKPE